MPRKRDGPAPFSATPGPGQKGDERPRLLPQRKTPRNTSPGHTSPNQNRRVRRRQPSSGWRQFDVRVFTKPDATGVHALHAYLRTMARRFGLEIAEIDEVHDHEENR